MEKTRVKVVAVVEKKDTPCWPCINHDYAKELKRIMEPVRSLNPDMEFDVVPYAELCEAQADYEDDLKKYDGVLVLLFTCWKKIELFYARQTREGIPTIRVPVSTLSAATPKTKRARPCRSFSLSANRPRL